MLRQRIPAVIAVKQCRRRFRVISSLPSVPQHFPASPSSRTISPSPNNPSPIRSIIYYYNVRLNNLGRRKSRVQDARKLFDEMPDKDAFSYATMISIYLKSNDLPSAENIFLNMPQDVLGVAASTAMISGYARAGRLEDARKLFDEMPDKNVYSWTCMMSGYFDNGQVEEGAKMFDQMPVKNIVSWTNLVQGYARNGLIDKAREMFDRMPERNVVSWTVMTEAYVDMGRIDEALKLFGQSPHRNLYTWNVILSGLLASERVEEALRLFNSMPNKNLVSWTVMVTGLSENNLIELAREYFDHMPDKDTPAWNAMITGYAHEGLMEEAKELFSSMPDKNVVTWNAMIEGYSRNGSNTEAFKHYNLMVRSYCLRLNFSTMTSLVMSCQAIHELATVHSLVIKLGFERYTVITNTLISAYSRVGDISSSYASFNALECKDIVSWRALMFACSDHGYVKFTLQVFAKMLRSGSKPDEHSFLALLLACCRMGLIKKGKKIFDSMTTAFGLKPKKEHYACIVDTFARAGKLETAIELIRTMPREELDGVVFGALLSACRLFGDIETTRLISKQLIDHIEPYDSAGYVLLANTYAAHKKWDELAQVRKEMKAREIQKIPGVSQIDIRGQSFMFYSGDKSHPDLDEVHRCLKEDLQPVTVLLDAEPA